MEYLRWMREPTRDYKDPTKVQILDWATKRANYDDRLKQLTDRTKKLAAVHFQVKCPWRIRVGGTKGPESILLPAFDALGMPYIPSSTLRGVARSQAVREILKDNARWQELQGLKNAEDRRTREQAIEESKQLWQEAHRKLAPYFGSLDVPDEQKGDRAAKIVFLDAYPLPGRHGLAMDMANNIWNWQGGADELPGYSPNPNPFLSLQEPTFLIGLRLASHCTDQGILDQVKKWLEAGLQSGIGSQVNTGYGALYAAGVGQPKSKREFFRVDFSLEGQLIHGCQHFTQWNWNDRRNEWQMCGRAEAEVRPVAFKSMLRYWFRTFALGVLEKDQVQHWESTLFGGIDPKNYGYLQVNILNGKIRQKEPRPNRQGQNDPCGEQQGTLVLSLSSEVPPKQEGAVKQLAQYLTWLMFNLGGIGQGARRPCYSRQTRDRAPWYRGSTFFIESDSEFWDAPDSAKQFCQQFQGNLWKFYGALAVLTGEVINPAQRRSVRVEPNRWAEAVDGNCKILICSGSEKNGKPFALSVLHSAQFKKNGDYDGDLCGRVLRGVQPSPVWIADLGDYQVVTIFGANQGPRQKFARELEQRRDSTFSVFPQESSNSGR